MLTTNASVNFGAAHASLAGVTYAIYGPLQAGGTRTTLTAATNTNVYESPAGSGYYEVAGGVTFPDATGDQIVWAANDGTGATVAAPLQPNPDVQLMNHSLGYATTFGQLMLLLLARNGNPAISNTWNATTHTLTSAFTLPGDSAPIISDLTVYPTTQVQTPGIASRSTTLGAVPQP